MTALQLVPDEVFAETFLVAVLQKPRKERWSSGRIVAQRIRGLERSRLSAARIALGDFKAVGIQLSTLSSFIDEGLQLLEAQVL